MGSGAAVTEVEPLMIGPYELHEPLGVGAFASVYRATDRRLDAPVAIKILGDNHMLDPEIRARFMSEARLLRRIDDPHLVTVHDVGETERGQPYLVLDYADGGTLGAAFDQRTIPVDVVAQLWIALRSALKALDAASLVHRDLKPSNILIKHVEGAPARFVVADLGFAKDLDASSGLTALGGTVAFSAPEQLDGGRVDHRSDLFAAGQVMRWASARLEDPSLAKRLDQAFTPSTAPDIVDRPDSIDDVDRVVAPLLGLALHRSDEPLIPEPAANETAAPISGFRWLLATFAALALIAGTLMVSALVDRSPDPVFDGVLATGSVDGETVRLIGTNLLDQGASAELEIQGGNLALVQWRVGANAPLSGHRSVAIDAREPGVTGIEALVVGVDGGQETFTAEVRVIEAG